MKIILFSNYGGLEPDVIVDRLNKDLKSPYYRLDDKVIEFVEKVAVPLNENEHTDKWFREDKSRICYRECKDGSRLYYAYRTDGKWGNVVQFSIVELDTSRRWTIGSYDGSEHIKYLDDMVCVDEKLNYWRRA